MPFAAVRKTTKRAAAALAEEKIKMTCKTLEEVNGWSDEDNSESTVCQLSDFDDLSGRRKKKARRDSSYEDLDTSTETELDASFKPDESEENKKEPEKGVNASENSKDSESTMTDMSSDDSSSDEASSEPRESAADLEKSYRQKRAEARRQHSNGPMILSRRMSYKLSKHERSPMLSPIAAVRLWFTPSASLHRTESA